MRKFWHQGARVARFVALTDCWQPGIDLAQTLGTILTRASCTALSRSASCWGSWYGMVRMMWWRLPPPWLSGSGLALLITVPARASLSITFLRDLSTDFPRATGHPQT